MFGMQEDLKLLINFFKPQFLLPIKGLYKGFIAAKNASSMSGFSDSRVIIVDNGDIVEIYDNNYKVRSRAIATTEIYVDGSGVGDISNLILNERQQLLSEGVLIVAATINKSTNTIISHVDVQMRGLISIDGMEILDEIRNLSINHIMEILQKNETSELGNLRKSLKATLASFIKKQ
jgi:ribonuclease J